MQDLLTSLCDIFALAPRDELATLLRDANNNVELAIELYLRQQASSACGNRLVGVRTSARA